MSTDTTERAKLGTTHLIPRGILADQYTSVTAIGSTLRRVVEELERKAAKSNHLILWHTVTIEGRIEPSFGSLGFRAEVQSIALGGRERAEVVDELFGAAAAEHTRRAGLTALQRSLQPW